MTQKQIAAELGCTQQAVSAWLKGLAKPDAQRQQKLQGLYGIPVQAWSETSDDVPGAPPSDVAGGVAEESGPNATLSPDADPDTIKKTSAA